MSLKDSTQNNSIYGPNPEEMPVGSIENDPECVTSSNFQI